MKIDIYIDLESLENKICNDFKKKETIKKDELFYLLFEMIKKRLPFDKLIEKLYRDFETSKYQITSFNLLCYLLDSCDSELRSMIFLACSNYMAVPLIANRP
jgi:two-component SAPR family response regulator